MKKTKFLSFIMALAFVLCTMLPGFVAFADERSPITVLNAGNGNGDATIERIPSGAEEKTMSLPSSYFDGNYKGTIDSQYTFSEKNYPAKAYLPDGYAAGAAAGKKYNVVFLLSGGGADENQSVINNWFNYDVTFGSNTINGRQLFSKLNENDLYPATIFVSMYCNYYGSWKTTYILDAMRETFKRYSTYIDPTGIDSLSYGNLAKRIENNNCNIMLVGFSSGACAGEDFMKKYAGTINNYALFSFGSGKVPSDLQDGLTAAIGTYGKPSNLVIAQGEQEVDAVWGSSEIPDKTENHYKILKNNASNVHYYVFKNVGHHMKCWFCALYISGYNDCLQPQQEDTHFSIKKYVEVDDGDNVIEPGIKFEVYNSSNTKVDTLTIGSDGTATSKDLPAGTYTVKQTTTEAGVEKVADFTVTLPADKNKTIEKVNPLSRGTAELIKKDKDTETPIQGATFILKNSSGKYYSGAKTNGKPTWSANESDAMVLTTDASGKIDVEKLKYGTYYFIEQSVPAPYIVDPTPHEVVVSKSSLGSSGKVTIEVTNDQSHGRIRIEKKGLMLDHVEEKVQAGNTVKAPVFEIHYIAGATFQIIANENISVNGEIIYNEGDVADTLTTTSSQYVTSKNLPFGKYIVRESVVPTGYVKLEDYPVELKQGATVQSVVVKTVTLENIPQKTSFTLKKLAEELVTNPDTGAVETVTNPKEGFVFGVYANQDIKGYDGTVVIHKDDLVAAAASDANGDIKITGTFPIANYYVQEISAPDDRYILDATKYEVTNKTNDSSKQVITVKVTEEPIVNELDKALAQIVKVDAETGKIIKMKGFKFDIFDQNGVKIESVQTNSSGIAKLNMPLRHGWTYTVRETAVPAGFVKNTNAFTLEIKDENIETIGNNEARYTCRFSNTRVKGSVSIEKTGLMITDTKSVTKEGYNIIEVVRTVEYLSGAQFRISAAEDIVYNGEVKFHAGDEVAVLTTTNGVATLNDMYLGKYKIEEIYAPAGYVLVPNITEFELASAGDNVPVVAKDFSFNNDLRNVLVDMTKLAEVFGTETDDDGNINITYSFAPGAGFIFALYNENPITNVNTDQLVVPANTRLDVCVSDENGKVSFEGKYPVGDYYIKELATPNNKIYKLDKTKHSFTVNGDDVYETSIQIELEEPVKNYFKKLPVLFTKTDITGEKGLPGALLEVKDENGTVIYRNVTDESGALEEIELIPGKYTIHEIYAPDGYALSEDIVEFEIVEDEEGNLSVVGSTSMVDEPTEFKFYKVDDTGKKKLSGAEFTMYRIYHNDGADDTLEAVMVAVSDEKGIVCFEGFGVGNYVIKETLAPEDYMLTDETIELHVTNEWLNSSNYTDGGELMMSIKNNPPPHTGHELSTGAKIAIIAGSAAFVVCAAAVVYIVIRKKKNNAAA